MNAAALQACLRREQAHAAATFRLDEELGTHHGLSWVDFVLLHTLDADATGMPERELASRLGLRASKLLMRLRPLEKLGLVSRRVEAGRPVVVTLRPAARRVLREAGDTAAAVCAAFEEPLRAT